MNTSRRRRITSIMTFVGLLGLFVCTFTLPEALVLLGRAASESAAQPLTTRGVVVSVIGFGTLVLGGVLTILGVVLGRTSVPQHHPEDDYVAEHFGQGQVLREYDPVELNPRLRDRERNARS